MKKVILISLVLISIQAFGQSESISKAYVCRNGITHFFASTPFEDIEASSNSTICVINTQTQKVYAKVAMTAFDFPKKLMQEHFNENYIESDKFPYATLEAVITDKIDFDKDGEYNVTLHGTFELHGVKKERDIKGKITVRGGHIISSTAEFDVKLVDHNIKIPTAVIAKIAEVVKVNVSFSFEKYQRT